MAHGADPNQLWKGWRPLNYAVAFSHPSNKKRASPEDTLRNVELLLKAGAAPIAAALGESRLKMTSLAWALRQNRVDIVRMLLAHGADPLASVYQGHDDLGTYLTTLVFPGADPYSKSVEEERDLALALLNHIERQNGREVLLNYVRQDPPGALMPVLHSAVVCGYYGVLAALIEKRVDLDQTITIPSLKRNWTALHLAEALGRLDMADALRKAGARDDILSNRGESPLNVRGSLMPDEAFAAMTRLAGQIARKDWISFWKDANREEIWRVSLASGRRGVRTLPPDWTGLDDAVRKAQEGVVETES